MNVKNKTNGLVLWSLILSPGLLDPEKIRSLFLLWEDIWRGKKNIPWVAKVPLSSVGLPGDYAYIHGVGGREGWFETHSGYIPGDVVLPVYKVTEDNGINRSPQLSLSYLTKKRLVSWFKKAYPQRFRPPVELLEVGLSWSELFGIAANSKDLIYFKTKFIEMKVNQAKKRYRTQSQEELQAIRSDAEFQFMDVLKTYRKRRKRSLDKGLVTGPRFQVLAHPVPEFYLCSGTLMAFLRCTISWRRGNDNIIITPKLPFDIDGEANLL